MSGDIGGCAIRAAVPDDLDGLTRIYNHYIVHSHVTFDLLPFDPEARRPWFERFAESGPHRLLVAEDGAGLAGYASSGQFRPKEAYRTSVETTVYVDPARLGRGIGRKLYAALLDVLDAEPAVHRAYGGIALPNPASVALHESLGFRLSGTFREVGHKLGRFWDVSWYERELAGFAPRTTENGGR